MRRFKVCAFGDSKPLNVFHGDEVSEREQKVQIWKDGNLVAWLRSHSGSLPTTATSQRLTNNEATELMSGFRPAAIRRSMPRM